VPDAAVTDTNALIYRAAGPTRLLSRRAAEHYDACDRQHAMMFVPAAVIWELSMLARAGQVDLGRSARHFFRDLFSNSAYQALDATPDQVYEGIRTSGAVRVLW
jgi:PIN domain nuclease of toxin-antitoxin system